MFVNADTGVGTCVEMCTGTPDDPACPVSGQTCRQLFSGVLNVCLPDCNPLLPGGLRARPGLRSRGRRRQRRRLCLPR